MKTIKIMAENLKNKSASIISIAILFAAIMFTVAVTSGCCAGPECGPYYGPPPGWHGNGGWHGDNGEHRGNGGYEGDN